jgi:hypothetical protein
VVGADVVPSDTTSSRAQPTTLNNSSKMSVRARITIGQSGVDRKATLETLPGQAFRSRLNPGS